MYLQRVFFHTRYSVYEIKTFLLFLASIIYAGVKFLLFSALPPKILRHRVTQHGAKENSHLSLFFNQIFHTPTMTLSSKRTDCAQINLAQKAGNRRKKKNLFFETQHLHDGILVETVVICLFITDT